MKRILLILALLLLINIYAVYGVICGNDGQKGYAPTSQGLTMCNNSIESLIIQGAGNLLKSHSQNQLLLAKIELAENNIEELKPIINAAVQYMEASVSFYNNLYAEIINTPYNQTFIANLQGFDYLEFAYKNNLDTHIMGEVESYLIKGDLNGFYKRLYYSTGVILSNLYLLKKSIGNGILPEISILWSLNNQYSQTIIFGQYGTMVFNSIQ